MPSVYRVREETGTSLLETLLVVAIMGILTSMAMFQGPRWRRSLQADGAMHLVMSQLNTARERAIAERRFFEVDFIGANWIRLTRREVPSGTTVLSAVPFEGNARLTSPSGLPDTPDAFGNYGSVYFGSAQTVMFGPDGSLVSNTGALVNGSVFLAISGDPETYRAITVLGSLGRVRGYRWNGHGWSRGRG
jgi:Tfp pilus assembly protein FimT